MIQKSEFFALHFSFFFLFYFFCRNVEMTIETCVLLNKYEPPSVCNTSLQSRVPNTILKFHAAGEKFEIICRKVSSRHSKKEESYMCHAAF